MGAVTKETSTDAEVIMNFKAELLCIAATIWLEQISGQHVATIYPGGFPLNYNPLLSLIKYPYPAQPPIGQPVERGPSPYKIQNVKNLGEGDCWYKCGGKQGKCDWCGPDGYCCRQGSEWNKDGCDGKVGGKNRHECTASGYIKNSNMGCYPTFGGDLKLGTREEAQAACDKSDNCKSILQPKCVNYVYFQMCYTHSAHYTASDGSCIYQRSVSCGGHKADSCAACVQGHGKKWCNGDCQWCNGICQSKNEICDNDFMKIPSSYCTNTLDATYSSFGEAKRKCSQECGCVGVYNQGCDDEEFKVCLVSDKKNGNDIATSTQGSCTYKKKDSEFLLKPGTFCDKSSDEAYSTFDEARKACENICGCEAVYSSGCTNEKWYTCDPGSNFKSSSQGSCIFERNQRKQLQNFSCGKKLGTVRISGGSEAKENSIPWQVLLRPIGKDGNYYTRANCGGTILSPYHVMTAAHCYEGKNAKEVNRGKIQDGLKSEVLAGEHDANNRLDKATVHPVLKVTAHPKYRDSINDGIKYDFAILTLKDPIDLSGKSNARAACLPDPTDTDFSDHPFFEVSGWGKTNGLD